jgi:hypothetical protein
LIAEKVWIQMLRQKVSVYMQIGLVFTVAFFMIFLFLWFFSRGVIQQETYLASFIYAAFCSSLYVAFMKRRVVAKTFREQKVSIFWAMLLSAILLHSSLTSHALPLLDLVLLALVSFLAGLILVDLETLIVGSFVALALCTLIMFLELSLPAFLSVLSVKELDIVIYYQAIRMTFLAIFPAPIILAIVSSIIGGYFGERAFSNA